MKIARIHQQEAINALCTTEVKNPCVALPTGSGKTLTIVRTAKHFADLGWNVWVVSHVKEILEQNYSALSEEIDGVCVYSNSLKRKEVGQITVAGIQSIYKKKDLFTGQVLFLIDEAHRCSDELDTMYQKLFSSVKHRRFGFSATLYRSTGKIYGPGRIFDSCVCDWTTAAKYNRLIRMKYLCPIVLKRTDTEMDAKGIKFIGGDYSIKDQSDKFDRKPITEACCHEIIVAGKERKKWLVFAIDISHAEHIAEVMIRNGISTTIIHSKMGDYGFDRTDHIKKLKSGHFQCGVCVDVLTTGYDDPTIDLIACMRLTNSASLHEQMMGRGSRVDGVKKNCLFMDFPQNCVRLGTIGNINIVEKGKGLKGGEPIMKACPDCKTMCFTATRFCPECKYEFKFQHGLHSLTYEMLDDGKKRWLDVSSVDYIVKRSLVHPSVIAVKYDVGLSKPIVELVCIEHKGFAREKALHWIKMRRTDGLKTVYKKANELAMDISTFKKATSILVEKKGTYINIIDAKLS